MHTIFLGTIFIIFCLVSCTPVSSGLKGSTSRNDAEIIRKMEYDWLVAEFKLDTATIAPMMDKTFVSVGLKGLSNKQQDLEGMYNNISKRLKENHVVDSFYLDDIRIQLYNKTAVVTFFTVTKGRIKGVPFENRRTRWYDVWIKRRGLWKAVSSQGSPVL